MHGIYKSTHKTTHTQTHKHTVGTEECSVAFQLPDRTHGHRQHALKRLPISTMTDEHDSVHEHCPSCHVCMSSDHARATQAQHSHHASSPYRAWRMSQKSEVILQERVSPSSVSCSGDLSFRGECPLREWGFVRGECPLRQ